MGFKHVCHGQGRENVSYETSDCGVWSWHCLRVLLRGRECAMLTSCRLCLWNLNHRCLWRKPGFRENKLFKRQEEKKHQLGNRKSKQWKTGIVEKASHYTRETPEDPEKLRNPTIIMWKSSLFACLWHTGAHRCLGNRRSQGHRLGKGQLVPWRTGWRAHTHLTWLSSAHMYGNVTQYSIIKHNF